MATRSFTKHQYTNHTSQNDIANDTPLIRTYKDNAIFCDREITIHHKEVWSSDPATIKPHKTYENLHTVQQFDIVVVL